MITPEGIKPNPGKVEAIKKFPIPKTAKEIKPFLGLFGYYRKFIKNFAKLTKPLTHCLKKGMQIKHTAEFVESFETCKKIIMNDPILQHPDFSKTFNLTTDASNVAIGAVLSQGPIGKDLPVSFASRTLNPAEINYSTIEKELLAIVWAVKYFRPYLFGKKFNIVTDHKPLQWLFSLKEPNSKLVRWRLKLEEYDYNITYKKGKLNTNADALSRIEIHPMETCENDETVSLINNTDPKEYPKFSPEELNDLIETEFLQSKPPRDQTQKINILQNIVVKQANTMSDNETAHTSQEDPVFSIPYTEKTFNTYKNQIMISQFRGQSPVAKIEKIFDKTRLIWQIPENYDDETWIKLIKEYLKPRNTYCLFFKTEELKIPFINCVIQHLKYNSFSFVISNKMTTDVTSEEERKLKLKYYHETKTCHRGINENLTALKKHFFGQKWTRM